MLEIGTLGWAIMIGLIVVLLGVDLVMATLRPHTVGFREAAAWSLFYLAVAMAFGVVFQAQAGGQYGGEYFAGYLVERTFLSTTCSSSSSSCRRSPFPRSTSTRC